MSMPDLLSSFPSTHRFATTYSAFAGASASNSVKPKDTKRFSLSEKFANLLFVASALIGMIFDVHLRQYLLCIQRYIWCDSPRLYLLGRMPENGFCLIGQTAPQSFVTAALAPLLAALCLSLRQSSSFPYCSGRQPHSYTVLTVATRPSFRRCPDSVCDTLTGQRVVLPHAF